MKKENRHEAEIDDLLKQVLKDDLPPEPESRMKRQFIQFRESVEKSDLRQRMDIRVIWRHFLRLPVWQGLQWMFRKEVLALSSLIMLALGGFMHLSGHRSALAESVLLLRTSVLVSDQIRQATSMECRVEVPAEEGRSLAYFIQWLSPDMTRVDVQKNGEIHNTLWISDKGITVADHVRSTLSKIESVEQIKDHLFQTVMGFLSPNELAERMYMSWQPKQYEEQDERDLGTFTFAVPEEKTLLEMVVDLNTYLPQGTKKYYGRLKENGKERKLMMQVQFIWNRPVSPQFMIPEIQKRSQDV